MTPHHLLRLAAIASLTLAAACANDSKWNAEAGAIMEGGPSGAAVQRNAGIQTGEISYVVDLQKRFAAEIPSTVTFAFNSAQLDQNARATLREQANWIRQFPEVRFKVYGHTDAVGSNAYNKRLGMRRARAVVNFLISQGISRRRLEAVVSFGETQPVVVSEGREPRNRRTVTEVTGFVQDNPLIMNGKYAEVVFREYLTSAVPPSSLGAAAANTGGG